MRYRTRAWALLSGQSRQVTSKFWKVGWLSAPLENHGSRNLRVKSQLPKIPFLRWDEKAGLQRDAIRSQ